MKQEGGWQFKAEYYRMASSFLLDYKFDSELERIIWMYHAEGISNKDINKILKSVKIKMTRNTLYPILARLKKKMFDMYVLPAKEYHDR